jgi:hypothetical protein
MIPAETLTVHEEEPNNKLQKIIYATCETKKFIHIWKTSVIRQVHEEGDILNCANYDGIAFLKTAYEKRTNTLHQRSKSIC